MQINGYSIVDVNNRPSVLQKVGIRAYFLNGGIYTDPYQISSITIFDLSSNTYPDTVLNSDNLLTSGLTPKMNFANSSTLTSNSAFNASNYTPGSTASGIFKISTGLYAVVLDGGASLSGVYEGSTVANSASAVGDYIAVWTAKLFQSGSWQTIIQKFHLFNDTFYTLNEPLLLTVRNQLHPKYLRLGSKVDLKVGTDITIGNTDLPQEVKNIFRDSVIQNPQFKILKINDGTPNLPAQVTVSSFAQTSSTIEITSDNTLVFNFDTNALATHPEALAGNMGSVVGTYALQAKFDILNQTFVTDLLHFQLT
jgi:hypothetical protein